MRTLREKTLLVDTSCSPRRRHRPARSFAHEKCQNTDSVLDHCYTNGLNGSIKSTARAQRRLPQLVQKNLNSMKKFYIEFDRKSRQILAKIHENLE